MVKIWKPPPKRFKKARRLSPATTAASLGQAVLRDMLEQGEYMAASAQGEKVDISIVIPIMNEAPNILPLAEEIRSIMDAEFQKWECIWVDDGSTDGGLAALRELASSDRRHRFVSFEKNTGQSAALWAGFDESRAPIIATIDGDGQNDPADIPTLFRNVISGAADMANGYRAIRQDNFKRRISSTLGNGFRTMLTGKTVRDAGCSTRVFRRECLEVLPRFTGMHRWLPTLAAMQGFKLTEAPVNHRPRVKGNSKYSISNRLWVTLADAFGVFWLKKRVFQYRIKARSDFEAGLYTEAAPPR